MPRGVTPTRVRRRQSDAKWRASVAMCYNIMKNVIPNQKKLGRRKVSKALTLKETERHIVSLERKLKELIEERAPLCGKVIMIEKEDSSLAPATFDNIKENFAAKQHALFMCTTTGGKKRYNVPSDIEASLDQLSQQSCELMTMDHKEVEVSFPHLLGIFEGQRLKSQTTLPNMGELQSLPNTPVEDVSFGRGKGNKTPTKKQQSCDNRVIVCTSEERETTGKSTNFLRNSTLKACKQLPFGSKLLGTASVSQTGLISPLSDKSSEQATSKNSNTFTQTCSKTSPRTSLPSSDLASTQSLSASTKLPLGKSVQTFSQLSSQTLGQTRNHKSKKLSTGTCTKMSGQPSSGFTPVKLPYGIDNEDPMMTFQGTPAKSTIGSPLGYLPIPETPGSYFNGVTNFELSDEEDVASLLCTESIDSMDLDINFTERSSNELEPIENKGLVDKSKDIPDLRCETAEDSDRSKTHQTKVRRRLDKDYESGQDQIVPTTDKSCLEFDGYLLFHKHSAVLMDPDCSQSEKVLNTAHMWEKLEAEDRALYARMASLDQPEDSNDLSADLMSIELKPLEKECLGIENSYEDSQEVPSLVLDLSEEIPKDFQPYFVEGYEDLGVFYHSDEMKENMSADTCDGFDDLEKQNQVVPQMG